MTIGRHAFRSALLLTCSTFSLTALSPLAFSQTPPSVANPQSDQPADETVAVVPLGQDSAEESREEHRELAQPKVWLGIGLKEVSGDLAAYLGSTKGVLVENVFPDSPAEAAGIHVGDIIIAINGQPVANPPALIEALLKLDSSKPTHARRGEGQPSKDADKKDDADQNEDADQDQDTDQDQDAAHKEKDAEKHSDDQPGKSAKKKVTYPPVKLTVLRQGKELTLEVTPTGRPESLAMPAANAPDHAEAYRHDLEDMLRQLEAEGGARILRIGPPARIGEPGAGPAERRVEKLVVVVQDSNGKPIEVQIDRVGDEPPKITVREGDKTREITEDQLDQLPEKARDAVRQALKRQEQSRRQRLELEHRNLRGHAHQRMDDARRLREEIRELPGVHIPSPEELQRMGKSAEELAAKYQRMAEDLAKRGVQKAQDLADLPDKVKELRDRVDELKKELEELRTQLKADKE